MFCPLCGLAMDDHEHHSNGSISYTCPKGCFEEDHPLVKHPGPGREFALVYYAGPPR